MPDATTRPTPEQIVDRFLDTFESDWFRPADKRTLTEMMAEHGYVIVHPDDVPAGHAVGQLTDEPLAFDKGWNDCRRRIFGADQ